MSVENTKMVLASLCSLVLNTNAPARFNNINHSHITSERTIQTWTSKFNLKIFENFLNYLELALSPL